MSKVIIEIAGAELDLAEGLGFGLNYQVDDVKNPTNRNGSYSKTITLAGTKNNNKVLGGLFDVNADFTFFNPNIKTDAKIIVDSSVVLEGFMQLKSIKKKSKSFVDGNNVVYEVVIFSAATDFFSDIKDKELSELDFSRYNHIYTKANIENSWSNTSSDVYTYPLLYKNSNTYFTKDFKPAIYHKAYLKRIAQEAGYTLGGTLLDESTDEGAAYAKEIVPFNGEIPLISDAEYERRKFSAGMSADDNIVSELIKGGIAGSFTGLGLVSTQFTGFDDDSTPPFFDTNGHFNTTTSEYTADANGNYTLNVDLDYDISLSTKRNVLALTAGTGSSVNIQLSSPHNIVSGESCSITVSGTTNYNGTFNAVYVSADTLRMTSATYVSDEFTGVAGIDAYPHTYTVDFFGYPSAVALNGDYSARLYFYIKVNGTTYASKYVTFSLSDTLNSANDWTYTVSGNINFDFSTLPLLDTDVVSINYSILDNNFSRDIAHKPSASTGQSMQNSIGVDFNIDVLDTSVIYNGVNPSDVTDGDSISINDYIPKKIKQSDIVTDLIKRYNAYIYVDEDNDRKIIVDTRDSYYAGGGILDWTDKKDFDYDDKIELLSELQNKELILSYKSDDDDFNKNYSKSVDGDIYGQKTIEFNNEFVKGEKKIETPFSPTPLIYNSANPVAIVPAITTQNPDINMRVLYFDGVIDTLNGDSWEFKWVNGGTYTTSTYTTYPYAGHYDNPLTPSLDLNFGYIPYAWYAEAQNSTNGDLYNRYWSNYINQINNGKLVTMRMHLNEVDVAAIRNKLNTKIWIRDSYYFVNKIKDYNPINKGLTVVEFLKIPDGVAFVSEQGSTGVTPSFNEVMRKSQDSTTKSEVNTLESRDSLLEGSKNSLGSDSDYALIIGENNVVGDSSPNAVVLGNNNTIEDGVDNGFIIGTNDKTVTESGEGWIGETHFLNGVISAPDDELTLAELLAKRDAGELIKYAWYYAYDKGFYFFALSDSLLSFSGKRKLNIIKNTYYSSLGVFVQSTSYSVSDKIIWGGRVWNCISAGVSASTDAKTLNSSNWEVVTDDTYYEDRIFNVKYSENYTLITEQSDDRGNIVTLSEVPSNPVAFLNYTSGDGFIYSDWGDDRILGNRCGAFMNNDATSILNNRCAALINNTDNIIDNIITGVITYNQSPVYDNNNIGDIYNNNITDDIRYNSNNGDISNNTSNGFIQDNSNNGDIDSNSNDGNIADNKNNGAISNNTSNALTTLSISSNVNNGYINYNNSTASIVINNNVNNGYIGGAAIVNRAASISDTIVNK